MGYGGGVGVQVRDGPVDGGPAAVNLVGADELAGFVEQFNADVFAHFAELDF